jgi:hypothetical protein
MRPSELLAIVLLVFGAAFSQAVAQTQYSIGSPTNEQQYMLELINRARADGGAEAARLGLSGLQEGPPQLNGEAWTISNTSQPLSWNPLLFNCAQAQATNLNDNDQFFILGTNGHTFGGMTPQQRIAAAGYLDASQTEYHGPFAQPIHYFPGPENIAETLDRHPFTGANLIAGVLQAHNNFFTDISPVPGRGHRSTTMFDFFREIGIGISVGTDKDTHPPPHPYTWDSLYIVQDFGTQINSTPFVTGVVYQDTNTNGFYDPGEGIGGIRVDVTGTNFFAVTSSSGGYSVPVPGNGSYTVTFSGGAFATTQKTASVAGLLNAKVDFVARVTATPAAPATPTRLANLSSRLLVGRGDNALFAGFIITGKKDKKVIIRAIGPSLGLPNKLTNPTLELYAGSTRLASNNNGWMNSTPADKEAILHSSMTPANPLDSAIVRTLPANGSAYTAIVRGLNESTGIGVVEVYELDEAENSNAENSKLASIATRGLVQTGDNILIAGTIVVGEAPQKVIVRAIGPSLNIPGKLADPTLELRDANGNLIRADDNWRTGGQETEIMQSGVAPGNDLESALIETLPANNAAYTAIVRGVNDTTGIAVVEVYALN